MRPMFRGRRDTAVIRTIRQAARTGEKGDGRIFVLPVDAAGWVRTDDFIEG